MDLRFFPDLENLILKGNLINEFPIGECINSLKCVTINGKNLKKRLHIIYFPKWVLQLKNVEKIHINHQNIEVVPDELSILCSVKEIFIKKSRIKIFPSHLTKLPLLEKLNLEENLICEVPDNHNSFPKLEIINLSKNSLTEFPKSLYNSISLKSIYLGHNQIAVFTLPSNKNQKLKTLDLSHNLISKLPDLQNEESNLNKIELSFNKIKELTIADFIYLKEGKYIVLRNNLITTLPKTEELINEESKRIGQFDLKANFLSKEIKIKYKDFFKRKIRI